MPLLTYLALCARHSVVVTGNRDTAQGQMRETNGSGHLTEVSLNPVVSVADDGMTDKAAPLHR